MQRPFLKVPLSDQPLLIGDVESTLSQRLNDRLVVQQGLGSIILQDEAAGPAVQICRQQEAGHGRLQMLLLILVCVEGVLQVPWDAFCKTDARKYDLEKVFVIQNKLQIYWPLKQINSNQLDNLDNT